MNFINIALAAYQEVPETFQGPEGIETLIVTIGNWLFTILLVLAVIFIVMAAYKYLFSQGGEETGSAHKMLIYSAVAVAVAILARGFIVVVQKIVAPSGITTSTTTPPAGGAATPRPTTTPTAQLDNVVFLLADGENPFTIKVQRCSDGLKPGLFITYSGGDFSNFPTEEGNPDIPNSTAVSGRAGDAVKIGSQSTGLANLGTSYTFYTEVCNDDTIPFVLVDEEKDGTFVRVN